MGAAIANQRVLESSERGIMLLGAFVLLGVGVIAFIWPRVLAWPLGVIALLLAFSLASRYLTLRRGS